MAAKFPSPEWLEALEAHLNSDEQYARIAKNWEGDIGFIIKPSGAVNEEIVYYFDLWHGKCRKAVMLEALPDDRKPAFILSGDYSNIAKIVKGELDPMQAMMTRKLNVQGSMAYMMRNVPTVLDFVRCCRDVTNEIL